jgi:hypothetical protein
MSCVVEIYKCFGRTYSLHHPDDCANMKSFIELFLQTVKTGTPAKLLAHLSYPFYFRENELLCTFPPCMFVYMVTAVLGTFWDCYVHLNIQANAISLHYCNVKTEALHSSATSVYLYPNMCMPSHPRRLYSSHRSFFRFKYFFRKSHIRSLQCSFSFGILSLVMPGSDIRNLICNFFFSTQVSLLKYKPGLSVTQS